MPSRISHALRASGGFTLIEVLATISVVGVVSLVAASNFHAFYPPFRTRGAALQIAGDMNFARLSAIKEGRRYSFVPQAGTSYQITYTDALGNQVVVKNATVAADYLEVRFGATGISVDPYGGAVGAVSPGVPIVFNSDGTVTSAAPVYVESTVTVASAQNVVWVTAAGRIRVWHFDGTTWK